MSKKDVKHDKAKKWWSEGYAHEEGGRIAKAIIAYRRAARLGNADAHSNLANLLDDKVSPARPKEAVYWYKRGVRAGSYVAAFNVGVHYRNSGNARWSRYWFGIAVKMGDPDARSELKRTRRRNEATSNRVPVLRR